MTDVTLAEKIDTSEMIEKFEEIQNGKFKSLPPAKAVGLLPDHADYVDGRLRVPETTRTNGEAKYSNLTDTGKQILMRLREGLSPTEIEDEGVASASYVSRNKTQFGFLLDNAVLFSAFVLCGSFRLDSDDVYVLCDIDEEYGLAFSHSNIPDSVVAEFQGVLDRQSKIVKLGDEDREIVKRNDPNPGKKEKYTDLSEFVSDDVVGDSYDEDPLTTNDTSSDGDSQDITITRDEWKDVVKVLYQMNNDELASKIIDSKL